MPIRSSTTSGGIRAGTTSGTAWPASILSIDNVSLDAFVDTVILGLPTGLSIPTVYADIAAQDVALQQLLNIELEETAVSPAPADTAITLTASLTLAAELPAFAPDFPLHIRGPVFIDGNNSYVIDQDSGFVVLYSNGQHYFSFNSGIFL